MQFHELHTHKLDNAHQKLVLNSKQTEQAFITGSMKHILAPEGDKEKAALDEDLKDICKKVSTKIFHARSAAVIKQWNNEFTSRSVHKSHACSLREYLK